MWRGGRVVECAGLEIRYTVSPYRGFESLPLRHIKSFKLLIKNRFISRHQIGVGLGTRTSTRFE